jgi:hypothetical protein
MLYEWLEASPLRPAYATLGWQPDRPEVAGIDQQAEVLGAAAVDLLVAQEQRNERGLPEHPRMILTEGLWRDGPSAPKARPTGRHRDSSRSLSPADKWDGGL